MKQHLQRRLHLQSFTITHSFPPFLLSPSLNPSNSSPSGSSNSFRSQFNYYFFSFFLNINQLCNIICRYKEKRWDPKQLVGSGGMPSSHSATVTALATAVGFHEGFGGPLFATALVMAIIV